MTTATTTRNAASPRRRLGIATAEFVLVALALFAPWMARTASIERVGVLLVVAGALEIAHGFRRTAPSAQRAAWVNGAITLAMGVLLVNAPWLAGAALVVLLAGWFAIDGLRHGVGAARSYAAGQPARVPVLAALGNLAVAAGLVALGDRGAAWAVAIAGALRIAGTGVSIARSPVFLAADSGETVVQDLGLPDRPEMRGLARDIEIQEARRASVDRGWIVAFGSTLFAIHLGRTGLDQTFLGLMTPSLAVLGDFVVALIVAFVVIIPLGLAWRKLTRGWERRVWLWSLAAPGHETVRGRRLVRAMLTFRLRWSIRLRQARYSLPSALSRGLQMGLPVAAIIAATAPVFGMSWYFDTENWAAGVWNSWAEERTDTWRAAMVEAEEATAGPGHATFSLAPAGVQDGRDFSFVVIGDTGEGDASQHVLRDRYLDVVRRDEVKFVVLSSDVVYPVGSMRDYEAKFWLPFKGTHKPVYAIPGNHDWYDALEAFNATFLRPDAARAAMRARIQVDSGLTTTTSARIEELIAQASRLRREYEVPTQFQRAPFFQIQTDRFALIAVDTGVARTVDPVQWNWLGGALGEAHGKLTMAVIGHPFYAGGHETVGESNEFGRLRRLLREHGVAIVMAGDTHDFEYYAEHPDDATTTVHHFVNGGGGAYLSFGTALAWPARPATRDWAYYPATAQVVGKIDMTTPWWKRPLWWWTRRFDAWPFSAEWLSGMFDVNAAPFFQSFVEVVVEPSAGRVRMRPHGIHGRLRWSDLQTSGTLPPPGVPDDALAEWTVEMPGADSAVGR